MTLPLLDHESIRLVLDAGYESIVERHPNPAFPGRGAFDEVAAAVTRSWYPRRRQLAQFCSRQTPPET